MTSYRITLLSGDGIGPEITAVARQLLDVVSGRHGFNLSYDEQPIGGAAIDACGEPLPASTLEACKAADAVLLALFGLLISTQVICFALVRAATPPERVGRALSAMNVAFFGGAAIMQAASGVAASIGGIGAALMTFVVAVLICCIIFIMLRARET